MSTHTDGRLREAYDQVMREREPADRAACPAPEALLAVVERTSPEEARLRVLDHVMGCRACRGELDLLRATIAAVRTTAGSTRWWSRPAVRYGALAASLLLAAGIGIRGRLADEDVAPTMRGEQPFALHEARRTGTGTTVLSWRPASGATHYELTVLDAAGEAVVQMRVPDTTFVLADSLARGGGEMVWSVSAVLGDGSTVGPLSAVLRPGERR